MRRLRPARGVGRRRRRPHPRRARPAVRGVVLARAARSHGRLSADAHAMLVHTHASEQRDEIDVVRAIAGMGNLAYLADTGLATPRLCAAHCVWVDEAEQALMAERDVKVMHCPGQQPEARVRPGAGRRDARARHHGVARCRRRGVQQPPRHVRRDAPRRDAAGGAPRPGRLPARDVVWMATRAGARTLGPGRGHRAGGAGFRADLIAVDVSGPMVAPSIDPYSTLVYACRGTDVRVTMVDGDVLVRDGRHRGVDAWRSRPTRGTRPSDSRARAGL